MKIFIFYCLFFFNILSPVYSQITIKEIQKKVDTISKLLPLVDSLKDLIINLNGDYNSDPATSCKKYIGYELYLPPINQKCYIDISTKSHEFFNGYPYGNGVVDEKFGNKYYTIVDIDRKLQFILRDNDSKEIVYFNLNPSLRGYIFPFIFVPYFIKQKEIYNQKVLIADNTDLLGNNSNYWEWSNNCHNTFDLYTGKEVNIKPYSRWICEVTLLKKGDVKKIYLNEIDYCYDKYYILKNVDSSATVAYISLKEYSSDGLQLNGFLLEKDFIKKRKQIKAMQEIEIKKSNLTNQINRQNCINKYGNIYGELISLGRVKIGMTIEMCKTAWGPPSNINKTTTEYGVNEYWSYLWSKSLYFENGVLKVINE